MNKYKLPSYEGLDKKSNMYREVVSLRGKVRRDAIVAVTDIILNNKDMYEQDIIDAAECLLPQNKKAEGKLPPKVQEIYDLFEDVRTHVSEENIFAKYRYGRREMKDFIKVMIKKPDPADRKWVNFVEDLGTYVLMKIGGDPPKDWSGYLPPYNPLI